MPTPAAMWLPLASIETRFPLVCEPVVVTNAVVLPDRGPTDGATPAPPPMTGRLAVRAADEESCVPEEKYGTPPDVPVVVMPMVPEVVTGELVTPRMLV